MPTRDDTILLCLSAAPSNRRIIRAASAMRAGEETAMIALFVETPGYEKLPRADRDRLRENMAEAERAGAQVEVVSGGDIPFQIAEYARLANIRRIVIGQSDAQSRRLFPRPDFSETLLRLLPEAEVHIIPDGSKRARYHAPEPGNFSPGQIARDMILSLGLLAAATLLGALFDRLGFTNTNIVMAYLLGVLGISVATSHRGYSLISAIAAVFLFNYFFVQPRFSLNAYEPGYPVTFVVMFLTAFLTGTLAIRFKGIARQASQAAFRTKIISDTDQMLAKVRSREEILRVCAAQTAKLLEQPFTLLDAAEEPEDGPGVEIFPIGVQERVYARLRVDGSERRLDVAEHGILLSILGECGLALENEQNAREKEEAAVQIENERMRSTLLRAISHDLRTPLTAISGSASSLLEHGESFDAETRRTLCEDIYEESLWLNTMVENLLASTRLEQGRAQLRLSTELIDEILDEAVRHVRPAARGRRIEIAAAEELLLVRADAQLIVQVLVNLLDNGLKHTPPESSLRLSAERDGDFVTVSVEDEGAGIPDEEKGKIFDMFYTGSSGVSDGRRSLGFGLALCQTIVDAHGGKIWVEDREPHGAAFRFTLPAEEVALNG